MIEKAKLYSLAKSPTSKKYALRLLIAVLLIGVVGFFALPPLVKSLALEQMGLFLHRPVAIDSVRINPYALSLTLEGVKVGERDGDADFVRFDRLYVNVESSSLLRGGPVVGELRLENPKLTIVRVEGQRYNFSDLLDEFLAQPKNDDPLPAFSINNIQISGGVIEFDDRPLGEKHVVSDITVKLPFVSSLARAVDSFVEPEFSASIDGAPLSIKAKSKPFSESLESEVALVIDDLQLAKYVDYLPFKLPIKVLSGSLDSTLKLVFRQEKDQPAALVVSGEAVVKQLDVKDTSGAPLLTLKQLELAVAAADPLQGRYLVDRLVVDTPQIHARVSKDGAVNWIEFFSQRLAEGAAKPGNAKKSAPVAWSLGEARIKGGDLRWLDESHGKPFSASVEAIDFKLKKLDSKGKAPAEFDLSWRVNADPWLKIDAFSLTGGQIDLARREVSVASAQLNGARSFIRRMADGRIDWLKPPALRAVEAAQQDAQAPWKISVANYVGDAISLRFEDGAVTPAVTQSIDELGFTVANLSTEPGQAATVATHFKLNRKGLVAVDGRITPSPLEAKLRLDVKTIEMLPWQPYFAEKLNIDVTRGYVTVAGDVDLRQEANGRVGDGALPEIAGGFSGQATIGDFQAVDKVNSADFLRWKSFYLGKVDVRFDPRARNSVAIGELALSDFFARVIVSPQGKLNLLQIVRHDEMDNPAKPSVAPVASLPPAGDGKAVAPVAPAAETAAAMPISIGKITLQGGTVRLTDNFVKPNYSANLRQIGGSISGLSSQPGSVAKLELRGSYDNVAPLTVSAQINPLLAKPYLDLQAEIKGVELTSLSSYSGKYAGYAIDKGKLSLFVKYKIENGQLRAENRVFLDQLTFGDPVDSPDATKLPVTLAVSLLKNRNGEIDIELPISGSLDDPQFSVGGLIVKVIVNLLGKALTSPFALLGSMFDGGEEMASVDFDAGRGQLTSAAQQRLEVLAKALVDRPALRLEVEGRVDPEVDREGLKRARIERKVRAAKREELTRKGVESGSAEQLEVSDEEYPALLERVYRSEKFPKPRNMVGLVKELPVEEMEKLMMANSSVDDEDLGDLGERRARSVRDWLVAHGVAAERVFLLPTRLDDAASPVVGDEKDKATKAKAAKGSRVDFTLK